MVDQMRGRFPSTPLLVLDSGNFSDNPTPQGAIKTRTLLEGMERMGYRVANVGERELKESYDSFAERIEGLGLQFISANLVEKATQRPVFEPSVVVEAVSPDGSKKVRLGVIGVARFNPIFRGRGPEGGELVIAHPTQRVEEQVARLRESDVDLIVLLTALHPNDARRIVTEVPGIDFVFGAYGGVISAGEKVGDSTWIAYSGNQGKRLGETRVFLGEHRQVNDQMTKMHLLTQIYPADRGMVDFLNSGPASSPPAAAPAPVGGGTGPFVGAATCRGCHAEAHEQWSTTRHAGAFGTLERAGKQSQTACRSCHATGVGLPGGFEDRDTTPELASVSCEACHGAGRGHVSEPALAYGRTTIDTCVACHDRKNSPEFDYYAYVAEVKHRARAAP